MVEQGNHSPAHKKKKPEGLKREKEYKVGGKKKKREGRKVGGIKWALFFQLRD